MVTWGYLNWPPLVIEQGTVLTVKVHRAEKMVKEAETEDEEDCLGSFAISGRKVFHAPKGADDCVAVSYNCNHSVSLLNFDDGGNLINHCVLCTNKL